MKQNSSSESVVKLPEIGGAINRLDSKVQEANKHVEMLFSRLSKVIGPDVPVNESKEEALTTELGKRLQSIGIRVDDIINQIDNILRRLEL